MNENIVALKPVIDNCEGELHNRIFKVCFFCEKTFYVNENNIRSCSNLCSKKSFCYNCLRNNRHHKTSNNILITSFKGIFAYYYYCLYLEKKHPDIWFGSIEKMIKNHEEIGLRNPVFSYDQSEFLWFIDFNKVGNSSSKAPFSEIINTIEAMFNIFDTEFYIGKASSEDWIKKEISALTLFYEKRQRPKDKKKLIPTVLKGRTKNENIQENIKNFQKNFLLLK